MKEIYEEKKNQNIMVRIPHYPIGLLVYNGRVDANGSLIQYSPSHATKIQNTNKNSHISTCSKSWLKLSWASPLSNLKFTALFKLQNWSQTHVQDW